MLSEKLKKSIEVALAQREVADEVISILETSQSADHSHPNQSVLEGTEESFTTLLKTGYDDMVLNGLTKNAVSGTFEDANGLVVTVVDGQITSIV